MLFVEKKHTWQLYIPAEAILTTKRVQIIDEKKFTTVALDLTKKAFVIHIVYLESKMSIHSACKAQIAYVVAKKVTVLTKDLDFADIFSKNQL